MYHSASDDKCKPCPLNSYNDQEGVVNCQACPKGSLTLKTGSTQISDCIGNDRLYHFLLSGSWKINNSVKKMTSVNSE